MADLRGLDDEALVELLRQRNPDALEVLYDRHVRPVFSLAVKMLSDVSVAEEVVQEVFLKLWRNPERFEAGRGAFRSWLLGVTHHRSIDELRSRRIEAGHRSDLPDDSEAHEIVGNDPDPADLAWISVQLQAVQRALDGLPAVQREVIELAYFKGLTHSEIAAHLQEPLGTIKTRVRLGIQKLRLVLETERIWAGIP